MKILVFTVLLLLIVVIHVAWCIHLHHHQVVSIIINFMGIMLDIPLLEILLDQ